MTFLPRAPAAKISAPDRWSAGILLVLALLLRIAYAWHFRVDSDEPQHLHVVWGWTQGLLPYRDFFDNHSPVFQALSAPLFHLLGVRADILLPMRTAMIPLFALTIWCVWKITATLFAARTALWTAVLATYCPPFFFAAVEYRPDILWMLVWLLTLTLLVTGSITPRRCFAAGLLLGVAFGVSMKTSLLLGALALAIIGICILRRPAGAASLCSAEWLKCGAAALTGMIIVPAAIISFFASQHAGPQMLYCIIRHNVLPDPHPFFHHLKEAAYWSRWLPLHAAGAFLILRLPKPPPLRLRIAFVFFIGTFYYTILINFWPILTAEDYLPFYPVMAVTIGPAALWLLEKCISRVSLPNFILPALVVTAEIAWIILQVSPIENTTSDKIGLVADTLKLTRASDYVMDGKGETIYRRRPFYYVLEGLTLRRLNRGLIIDDIPQRLIETRTPLASTKRIHSASRKFVKANYVPIAFRLRVAGQNLTGQEIATGTIYPLELVIPQRYTIVSGSGAVAGTLDGTPFDGPRELAAGHHEFHQTGGAIDNVVLVWANAIERGYSPFAKIKPDYRTDED